MYTITYEKATLLSTRVELTSTHIKMQVGFNPGSTRIHRKRVQCGHTQPGLNLSSIRVQVAVQTCLYSTTAACGTVSVDIFCCHYRYRSGQNSALLSLPIIEQVNMPCLRHWCVKAKCCLALKLSQFVLWMSLHWILHLTQLFCPKYGFTPFWSEPLNCIIIQNSNSC